MEGAGVHEVRAVVSVLVLAFFLKSEAMGQTTPFSHGSTVAAYTTYVPEYEISHWRANASLFLEGNKISVSKDLNDRSLWLAVGYAQPALNYQFSGSGALKNPLSVGMEVLGWSRMQVLSDFRFPVETVDYYFGAYATFTRSFENDSWRLRVGHISSHDVDGKDTVRGGSSSRYSREFVEGMVQALIGNARLILDIGVRAYFHQVTKIEPWVSVPATLTWRMLGATDFPNSSLLLFASSGAGPVWPSYSAGIRSEIASYEGSEFGRASDLSFYYNYGASWAGTDAGAKVSQLKLQLDVRGL